MKRKHACGKDGPLMTIGSETYTTGSDCMACLEEDISNNKTQD